MRSLVSRIISLSFLQDSSNITEDAMIGKVINSEKMRAVWKEKHLSVSLKF